MDLIVIEDDEPAGPESKKSKTLAVGEPDLPPVEPEGGGEGFPYAPEDWPNPGDKWTWRAGRRVAPSGYFMDRYLYLPARLRAPAGSSRKKYAFASRLAVERYVRERFPDADADAFFRSFNWKIPASQSAISASLERRVVFPPFSEEAKEDPLSDSQDEGVVCKARNKKCRSLIVEEKDPPGLLMPCEICCGEPRFCRDCCCILCSKIVDSAYGGYGYIRCEAVVDDYYICSHVAHLDCALQTYMAGTVGGSIDLRTEYYCRRCDAKTSLLPHVTKLLETCKSIDSKAEIEKMLDLGLSLLHGSKSSDAERLLNCLASAMKKVKCGKALEDVWKEDEDEDVLAISNGGHPNPAEPMETSFVLRKRQEATNGHVISVTPTSSPDVPTAASDFNTNVLQLEDEINQVLRKLKNSQKKEFRLAEEALNAQKNCLQNLIRQHDKEKSELLLSQTSKTQRKDLESALLRREEQTRRELAKLKDMESVAMGFGRTSKQILKEHFGLEVEE